MQSDNREVSLLLALILLGLYHFKSMQICLYLCAIVMVIGMLAPNLMTPLTKVLKFVGPRIQKVMSPIMLNLIYFVVVFPVGVVQKFGSNRKENFYIDTEKKFTKKDFERPF